MPRKHRFLVVVLSAALVTCATPHVKDTPGDYKGDEPSGDLARPDGELVSGHAGGGEAAAEEPMMRMRDPVIVSEESTSAPEGVKELAKRREAPSSAPPPRIAAPPPTPAAAPAGRAKIPMRGEAGVKKSKDIDDLSGDRVRHHDAVAVTKPTADFGDSVAVPVAPVAPAMKAGRHDDNKEYNRFLSFLAENRRWAVYSTDISERLLVRAVDRDGRSLPNCTVEVRPGSGAGQGRTSLPLHLTTYADGATQFFPAAIGGPNDGSFQVEARCDGVKSNAHLVRNGRRENDIRFGFTRKVPASVPVDVAIVLDTTGSMQGQIDRLKQTLKAIHYQLTSLSTHPDIRFGLVAYRDRGDQYVTQVTQFTAKVEAFQMVLQGLVADGGGDRNEDLQTALDTAMHQLTWRSEALRIGFIITDAPPHTDYDQSYTYLEAMKEALHRGIKWVTVGAGGLPIDGEVIYRQIAQYTMGEYVFVTQGGGGDSAGGTGEASHHVGANYSTENLDQAIVRIVRRELSYLTATPKDFDTTIVASGDKSAGRDEVLAPAVAEAVRQLADYSSLKLGAKTRVAIVPVTSAEAKHKSVAEYLTDQMTLSASRNEFFKVVERDMAAVSQEMKLQLSNLFDSSSTVPIGKMVGAEVLIVSKLVVKGGEAELFSKLIRVETGEVLSVAAVRVTGGAGFGS